MTEPRVTLPSGRLFIGGEFCESLSGRTFPTVNPATEEVITEVALADEADVDRAVRAARQAFEEGPWSRMTPYERSRLLWRIGDLVWAHREELAYIESLDSGKPIRDARNVDVPMVAELFHYYAGWVTKIHGETVPTKWPAFCYTLREPLGVCAAITPWNFPLLLAVWKIAPALACGNTVVHKPSETTPLSILKLAEIFQEADAPPGIFNVVTGPGAVTGAALVRHPGVDKIAFTGSTETGKWVMREAAATLKRVTLELGGKSPNIVFADADLEAAVRGAYIGIFYNQGEVCAAGSRLIVDADVHDRLLERLVERTQKLRPGDPLDPNTRMGPLANKAQLEKVESYVRKALEEGDRLVIGGRRPPFERGYFFEPTIFDSVDPAHTIAQEEIFGPVLAVIPCRDEEEMIRVANQTIYGLAAAVWTRDVKKAHRVARALKAGTVWVNTYNLYDVSMPFGGYKHSGFGRELGMHALEMYTQVKSVWVDLS
ncbi:Aldehyde dehydrogenase PuuC [bacterium HR11]|nr:Aldehyde dehydrogenase PuuC [bacterium HR11]